MNDSNNKKTSLLSSLLSKASTLKEEGNQQFSLSNFTSSLDNYHDAIRILQQVLSHLDSNDQSHLQACQLYISLIGNVSLVNYKLGRYKQIIEICNLIFDSQSIKPEFQIHSNELDLTKLYYRRGLAYEGLGNYTAALQDLQTCLMCFSQEENEKRQKAKMDAQVVLNRIQSRIQSQQETIESSGSVPSRQVQKEIIQNLLTQSRVPKIGETFCILDFDWWKQWCSFVNFDKTEDRDRDTDTDGDVQMEEQSDKNFFYIIPPIEEKDENTTQNIEDDSSTSSSSSDESQDSYANHAADKKLRPGVIDNSNLMLLPCFQSLSNNSFHREWSSRCHAIIESNHEGNGLMGGIVLKAHLVRGYHYEIIPREAYSALKAWYGECTPTITRRTFQVMDDGSSNDGNGGKETLSISLHDLPVSNSYPAAATATATSIPAYNAICGRVGLNNLGNTCFMNSALQCLSHATPLTRYFLTNQYKQDVNTSNPIGTGGKLAVAYESMIRSLWTSKKQTSVSPRQLKRAIALFAPRFAGTAQQDSQEFLAFLLDGLHEDLNRVINPPYIEKADVTQEDDLNVAGAEAWDAHCQRNKSIVMDSFYGQFKSTCICPNCKRISVSFDAFNHVSLEIPQLSRFGKVIPIILFRKGGAFVELPMRYGVVAGKDASVLDVKSSLAKLSGIDAGNLAICDVYQSSIYEIFDNNKPVSGINNDDIIVAYEIDPYTSSYIHVVASQTVLGGAVGRSAIGYPLFVSFSVECTCRQIYQLFQQHLAYLGNSGGDSFQIKLTQRGGPPEQVFPLAGTSELSPYIPMDSNEKLASFLPENCAQTFLFASIEWNQPAIPNNLFNNYVEHPSLQEAVKKHNAMLKKTLTLDHCLENFTQPERLDEDNKWYCSKCKDHVRAEKTMTLWRLPNILVIHLKRFEFRNALRREKLECFVDYPLQGLDMSKYCAASATGIPLGEKEFVIDDDIPATYDLFGVVNHYGRMGFGHYNAYARRWNEKVMEDDWMLFDDSSVRSGILKSDVVSNSGYLLFYRRREFA
ncbi:hypothetical protein CTEN210_09118 [Chaetoceros tenuissimus]|uniref:Ubiquitinyl hydrolase 1 n=1 Tax=Chaetoceros tenuissimus TaxID=426638 RepID=A0AAD3CV59_9STRA|nr:hypothetical protein CTEN210_09118 [Chaetoceros tenuissimus]